PQRGAGVQAQSAAVVPPDPPGVDRRHRRTVSARGGSAVPRGLDRAPARLHRRLSAGTERRVTASAIAIAVRAKAVMPAARWRPLVKAARASVRTSSGTPWVIA